MPPHNQKEIFVVETVIDEIHPKEPDVEFEEEGVKRTSFEDALEIVGFGKAQIIMLLICGLFILTVLTETMGMSIIMSAAKCDLELTDSRNGLISSVSFIGILLAAQLWGFIADTRGRRKVIMYTMFVSCACTFVSSFVTNFWLFLVFRFLVGFFISSASATIYAYLGEFSMVKRRAAIISYACVFAGLAQLYIPIMGWIVLPGTWSFAISESLEFRPWRLLLIVNMLPGLIAAILLSQLPESGKFLIIQGKEKESLSVLRWMYSINKGKIGDDMPVQNLESEVKERLIDQNEEPRGRCLILRSFWKQTAPLFQRPLALHFTMCCFLSFGVFFVSAGIGIWYVEIQNRLSSNNETESLTLCGVLEMKELRGNQTIRMETCDDTIKRQTFMDTTILGGYYVLGYLSYALAINFVSQGILLPTYLFSSGLAGLSLQWVAQPIAVVVLFSSHIVFSGVCISVLTGVVVMLIPTEFRGMAVSIALMFGRLGSIVGSNLVGVILAVNCAATFYLYTCFILVCAVLSLFLPT